MKQYYLQRLHWIFKYTSNNFFYCLAKTLCLIVGAPIYAVMFVVEMLLTAINMILGWIPIVGVVVTVICKAIIWIVDKPFYICILPDIKVYKQATKDLVEYEVEDEAAMEAEETDAACEQPTEEQHTNQEQTEEQD